jgi:isopentenyl phosphate kinase
MTTLDPELERLLKQIPDEDLKDLLALHGAGSFKRQCKAKLMNEVSKPEYLVVAFIWLTVAIVACVGALRLFFLFHS